jgi:selenocysteine-specific elongation factor
MMRVIGTAGHVDHGKSTLVQSLTGTHPDRLKEEREREMTIDLGFAFLSLPDGEEVGIVDVPGHRDFIENMLAGVGGVDAVLFVVAADEGIMPQTREHLDILNLLQIQGGVVALTKIDLIEDPEWLDLVEDDIRMALEGTFLEDSPIVRLSAKRGEGVSEILEELSNCLHDRPQRLDLDRPRLPIDRVFTIAGFGTVATGTLTDGHFEIGREVEILPGGVRGRIRGLQSHMHQEQVAVPGSRTAVNISGVRLEQIQRGEWVVYPGQYRPSRRLDLQFHQLPNISQPIKHNMEVKIFIGAAEVLSRLRLLGTEVLQPGNVGWIQVELREPIVAIRGDRYILRRPSPGETLGGGMVVDPHPKGRHKRFQKGLLDRLKALAGGTPRDVYLQAVIQLGVTTISESANQSTLAPDQAENTLKELMKSGEIISLEYEKLQLVQNSLITTRLYWQKLREQVEREVSTHHRQNPLRLGIPKEELKSRLHLSSRVFDAVISKLVAEREYQTGDALIWKPDHQIQFSADQAREVKRLVERFASNPFAPPSVKEAKAEVGEDVYTALVDLGRLVPVSPDVVFRKEDHNLLVEETIRMIKENGGIKVAEFRDRFNTSRKYALAFLEHLDLIGLTIREGDERRLK